MTNPDEITRDEARLLIALHGIIGLERDPSDRGRDYELDHNQLWRLGNGRLLWRQDSCDQCGESWELVAETIEGTATDARREIEAGS